MISKDSYPREYRVSSCNHPGYEVGGGGGFEERRASSELRAGERGVGNPQHTQRNEYSLKHRFEVSLLATDGFVEQLCIIRNRACVVRLRPQASGSCPIAMIIMP